LKAILVSLRSSRAWCGLLESRSGTLKIKQKLCRR